MPNPIRNRIACFTVAVVLASTASSGAALSRADVAAVSSYLESRRFERPIDRDYARSSIESIEDLKFLTQFPDTRFLVFPTAASSLTGHVAIVVNDDGDVFEVGEEAEFNRLLRSFNVVVDTPQSAENLARDYLRLRNIHAEVWEGVEGGLNFVSTVDDIPWETGNPEHAIERFDLELISHLSAPSLKPSETGFQFHGFTWAPFSGWVGEHDVLVHFDGTVEYRHSRIAYPYGKYRMGCTFPLDDGPSVDVLARLAVRPEPDVRVAVAEYLDYLTGSDYTLHQTFVKEHGGELEELATKLATEEDNTVRQPAQRALARLEGRADAR